MCCTAEKEERRAAFLATAVQELASSLDVSRTVATLARLFVPNLAEVCAIDVAEGVGTLRRRAIAHRDQQIEDSMRDQIDQAIEPVPEALARVMDERQAKIVGPAAGLSKFLTGIDEQRTVMVIPLVSRGEVLGVVTAGLIGIAVIPYVALRLQGYERTLAATFPFSARAIDYLVPAADSVALHPLFALHPPRTGIDERELFPGGVIIAAALLGGIAAIVMRRTAHLLQIAPWVAAGGFAFLFSFGPYLWPDTAAAPSNTGTLISLPYRYLARPLLLESLRSPARFGVIVLLAVAVIAAFAVVRVLTRLKRPWLRMMVVAALGLGMAVEYSVSIPVEQVAWGSRLPPVYAWLRQQAPGPVVELPGAGVEVSYYLLASTVDGHPRINGWSGFTPRDHVAIGRPVTAASLPGWLAVARTLGAEYLVVHADGLDPGTLAALRVELDRGSLMSVARFGSDEVFRFGKPTASRPGSGSAVGETPTSLRGPARGGS